MDRVDTGVDPRTKLMVLADLLGPVFGTENICTFLYSLVKMQRPRSIVELGTGLGVSSFWMAFAAKQNSFGHVWTVDDFGIWAAEDSLMDTVCAGLREAGFGPITASTPSEYFDSLTTVLQLEDWLTVIHTRMDLEDPEHFDRYDFLDKQPIDLLFSDFMHGPKDILALLAHFLPRMAAASSIFIDSASTIWSSYLLLEMLVAQLNCGKVPKALQDRCAVDLRDVIVNRRIVLVHLTESLSRRQNSTVWLKVEPVDVVAQPRSLTVDF